MAGQQSLLLGSALVIILFLCWQLVGRRLAQREEKSPLWLVIVLAMLSGVMNASLSTGGPPMALLAYMGGLTKEQAIGFISVAGVLSLIPAAATQIYSGMYDFALARLALLSTVASLAGIGLSIPLVQYMRERIFRFLLLGTLVFSVCMLLYRAF